MPAASRKIPFAVIAFLLLATAWPSAGEAPGPGNDYGRDRIGGMKGAIEWESLLHGKGLDGWTESGPPWSPGGWSREGDTVAGNLSGRKKSRITRGDTTWTDYELSVFATLVEKGSSCLQRNLDLSNLAETMLPKLQPRSWRKVGETLTETDFRLVMVLPGPVDGETRGAPAESSGTLLTIENRRPRRPRGGTAWLRGYSTSAP